LDGTAVSAALSEEMAMGLSKSNLRRLSAPAVVALGLAGAPLARGAAAEAAGNVVVDWNVTALETTAAAPFNPPLETRNLAIVHAAMFDAANAVAGGFRPYGGAVESDRSASIEATVATAAHFALVQLYPSRQTELDAALAASLAPITDERARDAGVRLGAAAAARILEARASDGVLAALNAAYVPGGAPGDWRPTPPASRPALAPGWGAVVPFVLSGGAQFRPGPPPALDSRRYARDFEEIEHVGSAASTTRTPAQSDLARFWVATASQNWNVAARQVAIAQRRSPLATARAFALLNLAGADAFIAAWDAKFAYNQWRPITAIAAADDDGNPRTVADPGWTPLLVTPPFPDYVAGHTTYAGAAEKVLAHVFGRNPHVVMTLTSPTAPGVVETYSTFADIARDVVDARVWGGIHWRTSSTRGRSVGAQVGAYVVHHALQPTQGHRDDHSCDEAEVRGGRGQR
jgi:hypothetical protein